jgi:hypothetical protein
MLWAKMELCALRKAALDHETEGAVALLNLGAKPKAQSFIRKQILI